MIYILKYIFKLFYKLWFHVRNRSLIERIKVGFISYANRKRARKHQHVLWKSQVGSSKKVKIKLYENAFMYLYLDDVISLDIYNRKYERSEQEFIKNYLRPGDIFIDVGAHFGLFSLIAASCVSKTGRVYSIEPCSKTYKRLLKNIELNNYTNVHCFKLALSDTNSWKDMVISSDGFDAWNSLAKKSNNPFFTRRIKCITYDEFVEEKKIDGCTTMVKIDVEGWENYVLAGGEKTLSKEDAPILQVEFSDVTCKNAGLSLRDLYQTLENLGYKIFKYDMQLNKLFRESLQESYYYENLLAIKDIEFVKNRIEDCI